MPTPPAPAPVLDPDFDPDHGAGWQVICLCAQWCRACGEYRPIFDATAAAAGQPGARFSWIDIEDEADAMGDVDIETFPTVLIAQGAQVHFLGPIAPTSAALERLVAALQGRADAGGSGAAASAVQPEAQALLARLVPRLA